MLHLEKAGEKKSINGKNLQRLLNLVWKLFGLLLKCVHEQGEV